MSNPSLCVNAFYCYLRVESVEPREDDRVGLGDVGVVVEVLFFRHSTLIKLSTMLEYGDEFFFTEFPEDRSMSSDDGVGSPPASKTAPEVFRR